MADVRTERLPNTNPAFTSRPTCSVRRNVNEGDSEEDTEKREK
jgi:hypothetical protein